jgi:site-specific recombinase XerD
VTIQGKPLSSLNANDLNHYRLFLQDPQPASEWIGRPQKIHHPEWKPFTGPLSEWSVRYSETVLNALFSWLVGQRYLHVNPMKGMQKVSRTALHLDTNRSFSKSEWALIKDFLAEKMQSANHKDQSYYLRVNLIVNVLYTTGLRLHELSNVVMADFVKRERNGNSQYWLKVKGKGNKIREVPVLRLIDESYFKLTGDVWRHVSKTLPLITRVKGDSVAPLLPLAIYRTLKLFFGEVSAFLLQTDAESSEKLACASTHWLRHTHGTHAIDMNIPLTVVRDNLGHSNIATTSQYIHTENDARYDAINGMMG